MDEAITHHISLLLTAEADNAYHSLLEIDAASVQQLVSIYLTTSDTSLRRILLEIIGEHRRLEDIPVLAKAVLSADSELWKTALDGLVKINDSICITRLMEIRSHLSEADDRVAWIDEALAQLRAAQE